MPQGTRQRAGLWGGAAPPAGAGREGGMTPLTIPKAELGRGTRIPLTVLGGNAELIARFAADMLAEYEAALAASRPKAVFIVPVGPVGQYDLLADRCNAE